MCDAEVYDLEVIIKAWVGLEKSLLFFSNDDFFVPNDHIFHCLNTPQNSPNLEYTSHLPKMS